MITRYLKTAWRNLRSHKATTGIHILGLTIGLTTCLTIGLFLKNEWSFDRHQPMAERTYRINLIDSTPNDVSYSGITPYPLGEAFRKDFNDFPVVTSLHFEEDASVSISNEKIFKEKRILFADAGFPDLFNIKMIAGCVKESLTQPNQAILTRETALRYYGTTDVIGKIFKLGEKTQLKVSAVMENAHPQTSLRANILVSYQTLKQYLDLGVDQWGMRSQGSVFVRLPPNTNPGQFSARMQAFIVKYMKPDATASQAMYLQPLLNIHFDVETGGTNFTPAISPKYMWTFGSIAIIVLLIACVNFINLSTARATLRAKEVGVRKTIGASSKQLLLQFLGEAALLTTIAAVLSIAATYSFLPAINEFLEKEIAFNWGEVLFIALALTVLTTLAAGLYPAVFLTRYKPVKALRGKISSPGTGEILLRQGLVVFQYSVSLVLAVSVIIIYQQMKLFREKDLGFVKEAILTADVSKAAANKPAFKQSLLRIPGVQSVSVALGAPTWENNFNTSLVPDLARSENYIEANIKLADYDYLKTYGLKLMAGRFLQPSDTLSNAQSVPFDKRKYVFVVNEAVVRAMNLQDPESAIGKTIRIGINDIQAEIIGVVRDFHVSSLHEQIKPAVIMNFPFFYRNVGIRLNSGNYVSTMAAIEKVWKQFNTGSLYEPLFLDDTLQELYENEAREFTLIQVFSMLALLICSLGLWGLSVFLIERRKKEIGVRKVLGASVLQITTLLSANFVRLVLIAIVVASPVAWYVMSEWLQNFSYRIDISLWIFLGAGIFAVLIAVATVSFGATKAALANPVKSLKTD